MVKTISEALALQEQLRVHLHHMDRNAKWFSSAIHMPPDPLKAEANSTFGHILKITQKASADLVQDCLVGSLARRFGVSNQTMQIRLDNHPFHIEGAISSALASGAAVLW
jgi:hypothetical protein